MNEKTNMNGILVLAVSLAALPFAGTWAEILDANDFCYYRATGHGETFAMKTASVTTDLVARRKFWAEVAANRMPVIYQLTFPKKKGWKQKLPETAAEALAAIDAFFAPGEGVDPCPEKIFAVTPCEENITWAGQLEVQDAIAKHLKSRYGVKTYQWFSEPLKPTLAVQADGWVFDAYCITDPLAFRAHLESFILTGVPVVPCLWGSGKWCRYHTKMPWDELTRFTLERMDMCRAFDLPLVIFSVDGKLGSVGVWFGKTADAEDQAYRETLRGYLAAVPDASRPDVKNVLKKWRVAVYEDGRSSGKVDLKRFDLVRETMFENVRDWILTPSGLSLKAESGRLAWWMFSAGTLRRGHYTLRHSPGAKGTFGGMRLSPDGVTRVEARDFGEKKLVLCAESPVVLHSLEFDGEGEYKAVDVELAMDTSYGRTDYRKVISFFGSEAALGAKKGAVATRRVVRRVALPGCGGKVIAQADVKAPHQLGASVKMWLSTDGKTPVAETASDRTKPAAQKLSLEHAFAGGTEAVYLVFDLKVSCGIDLGDTVAAQVSACDFKFRPAHP